eukprot:TRINITY_DN9956_c0_g2_i1.p2 TRINITY_DN9956_c0_g2~~TRINITY_DN9956_c0_g2_i1.p2  ORF type:complete len:133 (-),score=8.67 TRINITY_DN9956_c0_g2_i1:217-615(-)
MKTALSAQCCACCFSSMRMVCRHPAIRRACRQVADGFDGAFWMSMEDFNRHFDRIDVCDRSAHRDLCLDVREDDGSCGVVKVSMVQRASSLCPCVLIRYCVGLHAWVCGVLVLLPRHSDHLLWPSYIQGADL